MLVGYGAKSNCIASAKTNYSQTMEGNSGVNKYDNLSSCVTALLTYTLTLSWLCH
jgi:hypothetical protein